MADINLYNDIAMFDAKFYLETNEDVAQAIEAAAAEGTVITPQQHYFLYGADEGRAPNAWFDIEYYQAQPGLKDVDANLLLAHYSLHGAKELLAPNAAYANAEGKLDVALLAEYVNAASNEDVKDAIAQLSGETVGETLTAAQAELAAFQFFTYGITEDREGGIANIDPNAPSVVELTLQAAFDAEELPAAYSLTDLNLDLVDVTVADYTDSVARANALIEGAAEVLLGAELAVTYTLADTLENLEAAAEGVVAGATSYGLTNEDVDFVDLTAEQVALVQGAANAADYTIDGVPAPEYTPEEPVESGLADAIEGYTTAAADVAAAEQAIVDANDSLDAANDALLDARADATEARTELLDAADGQLPNNFASLSAAQQEAQVNSAQAALEGNVTVTKNVVDVAIADNSFDSAAVAAKTAAVTGLNAAAADLAVAQANTIEAGVLFGGFNEAGSAVAGSAVAGSAVATFAEATSVAVAAVKVTTTATGDVTVTVNDGTADVVIISPDLNGNLINPLSAAALKKLNDDAGVEITVADLNALVAAAQGYQAVIVAENAAVQGFGAAAVAAAEAEVLDTTTTVDEAFVEAANEEGATFGLDSGALSVLDEDGLALVPPAAAATVWADVTVTAAAGSAPASTATIKNGEVVWAPAGQDQFTGGTVNNTGLDFNEFGKNLNQSFEAQEALANFNEAAAEWAAAVDALAAAEEAQTAATKLVPETEAALVEANAALEAAVAAVGAAAGEDVTFVPATEGVADAVEGANLFVFSGAEFTINGFAEGDKLYVGEADEYVVTVVDSAADIRAADDVNALQIFVYQDGDDTIVAVEDEAFGGVAGELTNITLAGVNADFDGVNDAGNQFIEII